MNSILQGDCLEVLQSLPDNSVQCCVTSPPYYGLRSYIPDGHEDKPLEIGTEGTPQEYIAKLVQVFREVRRVLRHDGTLWLNIGDSYASSDKADSTGFERLHTWSGDGQERSAGEKTKGAKGRAPTAKGFKPKDLMMIPARLAIALQEDGYYLRSDIIWHKPSAMPESVTDRPTNDYEHVFLLAKSERYYYDCDAIREAHQSGCDDVGSTWKERKTNGTPTHYGLQSVAQFHDTLGKHPLGRNKRAVWSINTQPLSMAHFATMPPKLVEPCILAGSKAGDVILDPFCGAGTVPLVAIKHHRHYIGIELNPAYITLINKRIQNVQTTLWTDEVSA